MTQGSFVCEWATLQLSMWWYLSGPTHHPLLDSSGCLWGSIHTSTFFFFYFELFYWRSILRLRGLKKAVCTLLGERCDTIMISAESTSNQTVAFGAGVKGEIFGHISDKERYKISNARKRPNLKPHLLSSTYFTECIGKCSALKCALLEMSGWRGQAATELQIFDQR